jgi:hypothetical protein
MPSLTHPQYLIPDSPAPDPHSSRVSASAVLCFRETENCGRRQRGIMATSMPGSAVSQQRSLKEQLVGTWLVVAVDNIRADGSRFQSLGPNPKGIMMFDANGWFSFQLAQPGRPKFCIGQSVAGYSGRKQGHCARKPLLLRQLAARDIGVRPGELVGHEPQLPASERQENQPTTKCPAIGMGA